MNWLLALWVAVHGVATDTKKREEKKTPDWILRLGWIPNILMLGIIFIGIPVGIYELLVMLLKH